MYNMAHVRSCFYAINSGKLTSTTLSWMEALIAMDKSPAPCVTTTTSTRPNTCHNKKQERNIQQHVFATFNNDNSNYKYHDLSERSNDLPHFKGCANMKIDVHFLGQIFKLLLSMVYPLHPLICQSDACGFPFMVWARYHSPCITSSERI